MEDDYSGETTETLAKTMDCNLEIMQNKVAFCKRATLASKTQIGMMVATKISGLLQPEPTHSLYSERHTCPDNGTLEVLANKLFGSLLTNFCFLEKKLSTGMVSSYATRVPIFHAGATLTMVTGIYESLNSMVE